MRGAVVAETRTSLRENLMPNPSAANNADYYGGYTNGGTHSVVRMTDGGYSGPSYIRYTCLTTPSTAAGGIVVGMPTRFAITSGTTYTVSGFIRSSTARKYVVSIEWYNAATGGTRVSISSGSAITVEAGRWVQLSASGQAPAGATHCLMSFYNNDSTVFAVNEYYDIDAVVLEVKSAVGPNYVYFDGDSPNARWVGTPHASTSIELVDTTSKNLLADSALNYLYRPTLSGSNYGNIQGYWACPWRTVVDGTKGNCIECVTDSTTQAQGIIFMPQTVNSPSFASRPLTQTGDVYTFSADIFGPSGQTMSMGFRRVSSNYSTNIDAVSGSSNKTLNGSWARYSYSVTITSSDAGYYTAFQVKYPSAQIPAVGSTFRIANVQIEKASAMSAFEATRPDR